jgi:hypothetical protein
VITHLAFVAIAEIGDDILRPLIGFREQQAARIMGVDVSAQPFDESVRLRQVLAVCALALDEVGHRIEAEAVDAEIEPERDDIDDRLLQFGIIVVEVGLIAEEAVPVELFRLFIP